MQKLVNGIALLSGLVSLSVVAGGAYLYLNKDALVEDAKAKVTAAVTEAISGAIPGLAGGGVPELPSTKNSIPKAPGKINSSIPF